MDFALACLVVGVFALTVVRLELADRSGEVIERARRSLDTLRDPSREDRYKERVLRREAVQLIRLLGVITVGSIVALGLPILGILVLDFLGLAAFYNVIGVLESPAFLVGTFCFGLVSYYLLGRITDE